MFIRSQDKAKIVNHESVQQYGIANKNVVAYYLGEDGYTNLGIYSTDEKCRAVLDMILECYTMNLAFNYGRDENPRDLCCEYVADQKLGVFDMPQEEEVYENRND